MISVVNDIVHNAISSQRRSCDATTPRGISPAAPLVLHRSRSPPVLPSDVLSLDSGHPKNTKTKEGNWFYGKKRYDRIASGSRKSQRAQSVRRKRTVSVHDGCLDAVQNVRRGFRQRR